MLVSSDANTDETATTPLTRRQFLQVGSAAGGGLLVGFLLPSVSVDAAGHSRDKTFSPDAYIKIDRAGNIVLTIPQVEMGQGIYTSLAMILAEELDAAFDRVSIEAAPPNDALYKNPLLGFQVTGGSTSVRAFWTPMRQAGAQARALLVQAAAAHWRVDPATCSTANSEVSHESSRRHLSYGALVGLAAQLTPSGNVTLKASNQFRLIGQSAKRLDTPDKVNGKALFGIDAMPPGVKIATLAACPVFGGKVASVDDADARAISGVRQIVVLEDLVAVVADHMWAAMQGLRAVKVTWNEGANAHVTTRQVLDELVAASSHTGAVAKSVGDGAIVDRSDLIEATYHVPFLAHAPMEPMNCTAHVTENSCEIWVGNQVISRAQAIAAKITGLPLAKVSIHNHLIGGGFGRRLEVDGIAKAVRIAQKVDGPVKVIWTREEDIQQALYRPFYYDKLAARLSHKRIDAWSHRIIGSSILARWAPPAFVNGLDKDAVDGAVDLPYDVPNIHIEYVRCEPPAVPTCFWRGVGPAHNSFVIESFVDELAHAAGLDSLQFRRNQLTGSPRLLACLEMAAQMASWGKPLPPRTGRGVSVQAAFGTFLATIAEAEVDNDGEVKVRRIVCAVDCGIPVNPNTIAAQLEGGVIFGLTAALHGEITVERGRVQQSNFNNYRMMRINETPQIEVHVMESHAAPGGVGEPGTAAVAPALANALFAATGVRLRHLPIDRNALAARRTG
jgi:isoquinoline 1-oxidoreductase beta subunit